MLIAIAAVILTIAQAKGPDAGQLGGAMFLSCFCPMIVVLVIVVPVLIAQWKIFDKAGEPGWASFIPVYNVMVLARICGKDELYGLLCFIPLVGIVFSIILCIELAKSFGKDIGFAIGLILLPYIFMLILGFGSSEYIGPEGKRRRRRRLDDDDDDYDSRAPRLRRRNDDRVRRPSDEVEEDRPRRRRPQEDDEDRPRRRQVEDEDEDRPRRRRAEEDDEERPRRRRPVDDDDE
jgi:hypothetical protein